MLTAFITIGGIMSFQRMPVDAYPDLAPPQVEIITQWPGHAAEEVERLVTLPLELEMNGVPHMEVMRSISLYGLSDVILTFEEDTDSYFARQIVFERLADATVPSGVVPGLAPLFSPSGLVYRYVLQSPDRTPQDLKTIEDWVVERAYRSVPGVADDSGFGGTTMQYQVLLDPARIYGYHLTIPQVVTALSANNANAGGGFYSQGGQFYYVRGIGLVRNTDDIGNVVVGSNKGVPIRVRDIGDVTIGYAPRLGEFGFQKNDDAVEGVILMLRGGQTQNVLRGSGGQDGRAESQHPAAGRQDCPVLRPQRTRPSDHRHGGSQSASWHGTGADRSDLLSGKLPRRGNSGAYHPALTPVCFHRPPRPRCCRQSALHWRN